MCHWRRFVAVLAVAIASLAVVRSLDTTSQRASEVLPGNSSSRVQQVSDRPDAVLASKHERSGRSSIVRDGAPAVLGVLPILSLLLLGSLGAACCTLWDRRWGLQHAPRGPPVRTALA